MNFFYPKLRRSQLPAMTGITLLGGLLGGIYGAIHDWFTYSISSEYFTLMKFVQFSQMDMGFPPHVFAAQIGFIAAGAVGLAIGWFIARTAVPAWPTGGVWTKTMRAFLLLIVISAGTAVAANFIGLHINVGAWIWQDVCGDLDVADVPAFLRVALIHTAGYLGALAGLIVAILRLRRAANHS